MPRKKTQLKFDTIGYWSEIKLEIIEAYAREYSKIISNQKQIDHVYIDAFAGAGVHKSKTTGDFVPGSPMKALLVKPPFKEYHFIDLDSDKVDNLKRVVGERSDISIYTGNCNSVLLKHVFPKVQYADYKRGLCLLDPYGLQLDWEVIETAGKMETIEIFLNFPIVDMNRNVFWHDFKKVRQSDIERMNAYWGDETWRSIAYTTKKDLFGHIEKETNRIIAEHFKDRLKKVAGFSYVSEPLAMRNSKNAIIYYLFFAAQKPVAKRIVDYIFDKYSKKRV